MDAINERLFQLRDELGLSRAKFGAKLGVSLDVIKNLDVGKTKPKPEFINLVCHIYGVAPDWLNYGKGEMFMPKDEKSAVEEIFANAQCEDPRKRKLLSILANAIAELPDEAIAAICEYAKEIADAAEDTDSPDE